MNGSPKRGLLAAYGRLLGPLIRILIRNGVSFGEFAEVAKQAYVEVAAKEFRVGASNSSITRIAVLTGVEAEEAKQIRVAQERAADEKQSSSLNQIVAVLSGWHTDSEFTGPYGVPLELRLDSPDGRDFSLLCARYCPGIDPTAFMNELIRVGVAQQTSDGWFKAITRAYLPRSEFMHSMEHLTEAAENIVRTIDHNLTEPDVEKRLLERQVYADDGILPEDLPRFRKFIKKRSQLFLEEIDNWLSQLDRPKEEDKRIDTGVGVYHFLQKPDKQ
jgi:hypothetical protein